MRDCAGHDVVVAMRSRASPRGVAGIGGSHLAIATHSHSNIAQLPHVRQAFNGSIFLAADEYFSIADIAVQLAITVKQRIHAAALDHQFVRVIRGGAGLKQISGEGGIRTHDTFRYTRSPSERTRPAMRPLRLTCQIIPETNSQSARSFREFFLNVYLQERNFGEQTRLS